MIWALPYGLCGVGVLAATLHGLVHNCRRGMPKKIAVLLGVAVVVAWPIWVVIILREMWAKR